MDLHYIDANIVVLFLMCITLSFAKICSKVESHVTNGVTIYSTVYYCCSDYVEIHGSCKRCPKGFFADPDNGKCKACPDGNFGEKCAFDCKCNPSERCDNVDGCVSKIEHKECETGFQLVDTECVACPPDYYGVKCALTCDCQGDERCDATKGCVKKSAFPQLTLEHTPKPNEESSSETSKYVYGSGIGGAVILMFACIAVSVCKYVKYRPMINQNKLPQETNNKNSDCTDIYDEIDDYALGPVVPLTILQPQINPNPQNTVTLQTNTSGYIEPLQAVHEFGSTQQINSSAEATKQPDDKRLSGYLNPYQLALKDFSDVHKYSTTNITEIKPDLHDKPELTSLHQYKSVFKGTSEEYESINAVESINLSVASEHEMEHKETKNMDSKYASEKDIKADIFCDDVIDCDAVDEDKKLDNANK